MVVKQSGQNHADIDTFASIISVVYPLFFVEFKIAMIGYVSACVIQIFLYKIFTGKFSTPYFTYFLSGLIFTAAALYFEKNAIFMYEMSFLLMISAIYILITYFKADKGALYIMGIPQPVRKNLASLTYLNYLMASVYMVAAIANIAIIQYFSPTYWVNFRVFGVYLFIMLVSAIVGFTIAKSEINSNQS